MAQTPGFSQYPLAENEMAMAWYLHAEYDFDLGNREDDYIGPFPDEAVARGFMDVVGTGIAQIKDLDYTPPAQRTMSPGQFLDYTLSRWQ